MSLIAEIDQRIDHLLEPYQQEVELFMTKRNRRRGDHQNRNGYEHSLHGRDWQRQSPSPIGVMRDGMGVIPMQESTIGVEILVSGGSAGKEESTHRDCATDAFDHVLHDHPKGTVPRTTNELV